jgi:hypothetical protein
MRCGGKCRETRKTAWLSMVDESFAHALAEALDALREGTIEACLAQHVEYRAELEELLSLVDAIPSLASSVAPDPKFVARTRARLVSPRDGDPSGPSGWDPAAA